MKKEIIMRYAVCFFALFFLMVPDGSAGWEEMEVIKQDFVIDSNEPRHQWYPWIAYNSVDDEFMLLWHTSGPLRDDCDPGDDYECTGAFHSIDGRRVSTDGGLLGELIQLAGPDDERYMNGSRPAYNKFTNEYMTVTPIADTPISFDVDLTIARINNVGDIQYGLTSLWPGGGSESMIPIVVFNPLRREYLVAYSDRNIYNAHLNLVGFILNEDGTPRVGPFPIGNQLGDYYAPRVAHNPNEDTYLVVWEDMRNVVDWADPIDIYGALLDSDGNMIVEIAVIDDHDIPEPDAGDQRVPVPVYNPDKDEFLVIWEVDEQPWVDDSAIKGRFLNPDGSIKSPIFTIVDEPRQQHWPDIQYIAEYQKYFMVWNDCRNDGQPAGTDWWVSPAMDVYARWLDDTGSPIGDEILIAEREGAGENWKQIPVLAYSPVAKRFLIPWYDRRASGTTAFGEAPSDIKATLYGIPPDAAIKIGDQWANCGDVGVKIPICLINLEVEVGAVQVDLCEDVDDCLICVGCEMTERTTIFDCMVNELENGCCAVVVFSKNPGGVINPGECDIVIIDYTLKDDPQCCNSCITIDGENLEIVDQYGYIVDSLVSDLGMICPFECGDIEPAATTAGWNCGDGDIDIFDILEEVDFIIHVKTPDDCQAVRADVPTGTPPNCDPPDGVIDVGDLMVIIDMALNRQDCCSYYYGGVIY